MYRVKLVQNAEYVDKSCGKNSTLLLYIPLSREKKRKRDGEERQKKRWRRKKEKEKIDGEKRELMVGKGK